MIVIGLTGGIASGKSYVAHLLAELGAVVLDADMHAQQLLDEPEVQDQLVARWGDSILSEEGKVSRTEIANRVFGDQPEVVAERQFLEGIIHPLVRSRLKADLAKALEQGLPAAVLDIPLLHESGWAESCDTLIFVDTPDSVRQERAALRGWEPEELSQREGAQMPIMSKRKLADYIIPGGTTERSATETLRIWNEVLGK